MKDDPILKKRLEPNTAKKKTIGSGFISFTLKDIKVSAWTQIIQNFYTFIAMKNLAEREKYMILFVFTLAFSKILRDRWNDFGIVDYNTYLKSQDFSFNIRII